MKIVIAFIVLAVAGTTAAFAATSPAQLETVRIDSAPNAAIPMALSFSDETGAPRTLGDAIGGTPAVLVFADYTCTNLCGPILAFAAGALEQSSLIPGRDFHLVVIGLDPKDGPKDARAIGNSHIGMNSPLAAATALLIGREPAISVAAEAAGFHYIYDAEHDQFAHPAAAYVLTREGRIARVLSGLELNGNDLRLALIEAGQGRVGSFLEQITLRCFGFDPARAIHTASILRWLKFAAAGCALFLLGSLSFMVLTMRRRLRS